VAAADLARATEARLQLIAEAPTVGTLAGRDAATGRYMPGTTHAMLDMLEDELRFYLGKMLRRFESLRIDASAIVSRGEPEGVIAENADAPDVDMLIFATHGKAGTKAFWAHSVGARMLAQTSRPVLVVLATVEV
jgi:nucleotide-binding universal stress UspA family protein